MVAVLVKWVFAVGAFLVDVIEQTHFIGVTLSIAAALLPLAPGHILLKRRRVVKLEDAFGLVSHVIQIASYTSLIYFLEGNEATYLLLIYAAVIVYEGILSSRKFAYRTASICSAFFSIMVFMEYVGILPLQKVVDGFELPLINQILIVLVSIGLMFVVAVLTDNTAMRLKKQNGDLELAVERVKDADGMKSQFLANMSHELRTPLNHIIGFTDLVLGKQLGPLNDAQEEYLTDVHGSSSHLLSLVNDLLDLSKVYVGKIDLEIGGVQMHDVIWSSLNMVSEKALRHGIQISSDLTEAPESIRGDNRKIKQIMYNLVSIAV